MIEVISFHTMQVFEFLFPKATTMGYNGDEFWFGPFLGAERELSYLMTHSGIVVQQLAMANETVATWV